MMSRKMRKSFFSSFLILSYVHVLSVLALEASIKSDDQDFKVLKHVMSTKEIEGSSNGRENMKHDVEEFADKHLRAVFPEKSQKGKGSYGGANVVHRRPGEKSVAPALQSSCALILISISTLCIISFPVSPFLIF